MGQEQNPETEFPRYERKATARSWLSFIDRCDRQVGEAGVAALRVGAAGASSAIHGGRPFAIATGGIVASAWSRGTEIPLHANGQLIGWAEFEPVGGHIGARITELV